MSLDTWFLPALLGFAWSIPAGVLGMAVAVGSLHAHRAVVDVDSSFCV